MTLAMRADAVNDFQLTCSQNNSIFRLPKFVLSVTACKQRHKPLSAASNILAKTDAQKSTLSSVRNSSCTSTVSLGSYQGRADQGEVASSVRVDETNASDSSMAMRSQMLDGVLMHITTRLRFVLLGCISPLVLSWVTDRYNCYAVAAPS